MEVSYRRDLNHNYMIIEDVEISGREYTVHMMERNHIPGLLKMSMKRMNGTFCLYYEISSRQPLTRMFENSSIDSENMRSILSGIMDALGGVHQYLLDSQDLLLDPEYIYMDIETKKVWLCYVPGLGEEMDSTVPGLAEFLLKKLNHGDWLAVELGYQFYGDSEQDNFNLQESIQRLLSKTEEKPPLSGNSEKKERVEFEIEEDEGIFMEKERKSLPKKGENEKGDGRRKVLQKVLICSAVVVVFSMGFGGVVWLCGLDLTQTGGLAFLLLAMVWMVYSIVSGREKERKSQWLEDAEEDTEEAFMEALMSELYEEGDAKDKKQEEDLQRQMWRKEMAQEDQEDMFGETRCLAVKEEAGLVHLVSLAPEQYASITVKKEEAILGKLRSKVDICLSGEAISRIHAKIETQGEDCFITDLNSMNGTFLNGERLRPNERRQIFSGDKVNFATWGYLVE